MGVRARRHGPGEGPWNGDLPNAAAQHGKCTPDVNRFIRVTLAGMREDPFGGMFVALASLQFGGVVVLGKVVSRRGVPVSSMLAVRFAVAALIIGVALAAARRPIRPARGEGARLVLLGAIGYGGEAGLFFLAIAHGTASAVTLLFFVYPVLVTVFTALLSRRLPRALVVGSLAAAVAGSALVVASSGGLDITGAGIGFALGSATLFSLYLLGAERTLRRTTSTAGAMTVSASAAAALATAAIVTRARLPAGPRELVPVIGMGIFTAGAFLCLFAGLRRVGAVRTSIIAALEPLSTATLAIAFLGEPLRIGVVLGGALVLSGSVAAGIARRPGEPEAFVP